jgi:hypothetical protein
MRNLIVGIDTGTNPANSGIGITWIEADIGTFVGGAPAHGGKSARAKMVSVLQKLNSPIHSRRVAAPY